MQVLCDFLVKKTDLMKPDPNKPYPYEKDLRFVSAWEKGCAPWQMAPRTTSTVTEPSHAMMVGGPVPGVVPQMGGPIIGVPFVPIPAFGPPANPFMCEIPVWSVRQWYQDVSNIMITVSAI